MDMLKALDGKWQYLTVPDDTRWCLMELVSTRWFPAPCVKMHQVERCDQQSRAALSTCCGCTVGQHDGLA